ncbi:hypothetical protein FGO68_gene13421 [Halteria grandinella]|uniref:Uncharacterized protein n=1 Tax=Halteria grandinella TaxID=5974 RepID=A0A8J8NYP9_HALGN|nr:hypothetical protein FGO68_gene13421 [Halteria grandinella]
MSSMMQWSLKLFVGLRHYQNWGHPLHGFIDLMAKQLFILLLQSDQNWISYLPEPTQRQRLYLSVSQEARANCQILTEISEGALSMTYQFQTCSVLLLSSISQNNFIDSWRYF